MVAGIISFINDWLEQRLLLTAKPENVQQSLGVGCEIGGLCLQNVHRTHQGEQGADLGVFG